MRTLLSFWLVVGAGVLASITASVSGPSYRVTPPKMTLPEEAQGAEAPLPMPPIVADTDFPMVDVEAWCARMSPTPVCIRTQQRSYDYAQSVWPTLSKASQIKCAAMMRKPAKTEFSVAPEYQLLAGCVELQAAMDQAERDRVSPPRFRP